MTAPYWFVIHPIWYQYLQVLTSHVDRPDRFMKAQVGYGIAQTGEAAAPTIHPEVRDMYCSPTAS
jgi:hypothetical protein